MELNIGTTVKRLRLERGLTQEELANSMNVSAQAVSKWENNTTTPDIALLPKLAIFFGVSLDMLFSLDKAEYLERIANMIRDDYRIDSKDFLWAESYLKELLQEDESHEQVRTLLVELYGHRINRDQLAAIRLCRDGLLAKPEDQTLHDKLVRLGKTREDLQMLTSFYSELYQSYPQSGTVAAYFAKLYILAGRYEEAQKLVLLHSTPSCELLQAEILCAQDKQKEAFAHLEKLADDQADTATLFAVAECFEKHGEDKKAENYYLVAYERSPSPKALDALYSLAFMYSRTERYANAIGTWEHIISDLKHEYGITKGECIDWANREIACLKNKLANG